MASDRRPSRSARRARRISGTAFPTGPGRFAARRFVWDSCLVRHPMPRALALARELMSLAERGGDAPRVAIACRVLGQSLFQIGKPAEADPVLARGVALADGVADTEFAIYGEDQRTVFRLLRGRV